MYGCLRRQSLWISRLKYIMAEQMQEIQGGYRIYTNDVLKTSKLCDSSCSVDSKTSYIHNWWPQTWGMRVSLSRSVVWLTSELSHNCNNYSTAKTSWILTGDHEDEGTHVPSTRVISAAVSDRDVYLNTTAITPQPLITDTKHMPPASRHESRLRLNIFRPFNSKLSKKTNIFRL